MLNHLDSNNLKNFIKKSVSESLTNERSDIDLATDDEKKFISSEISKAEKTGRSIITYEWAGTKITWNTFKYFINSLIDSYRKQNNLNSRNAIMAAFSPYQANDFSSFYQTIAKSISNYSESKDFNDTLTTSIYDGIEKALTTFEEGNDFVRYLIRVIKNSFIDKWRKENEFTADGEKYNRHIGSLSDKVNGSENTVEDMLDEPNHGTENEMNRTIGKRIWKPFVDAIKELLKGHKEREEILDLFVNDGLTKSSEIYKEMKKKGFYSKVTESFAENAIRVNIDRIQKLIAHKMSVGYFSNYIKNTTKSMVNFLNLYKKLPKTRGGQPYFPLEIAKYDNFTELVPNVIAEANQLNINTLLEQKKLKYFIRKNLLESISVPIEGDDMIDEERITNPEAKEFVKARQNFIGSHIYGEDIGDLGEMYVAYSYGVQYPAYLFYKDKWYHNTSDYINDDGSKNEYTLKHMEDMRPTNDTHGLSGYFLKEMIKKFIKAHDIKGIDHTSVEPGVKN